MEVSQMIRLKNNTINWNFIEDESCSFSAKSQTFCYFPL